ncbi:MAG: hypothetical protein AAGD01_09065 [Acidobacteriota bacterium]
MNLLQFRSTRSVSQSATPADLGLSIDPFGYFSLPGDVGPGIDPNGTQDLRPDLGPSIDPDS